MDLLEINNLSVSFAISRGSLAAVSGVSLSIAPGEVLGLVGESGSGKSVTSRAVLGLLPRRATVSGSIRLAGQELLGLPERALRRVRGEQAAMVFQDPLTTLNPVFPVGEQVAETLRFHKGLSRAAADAEVLRLFERVGMPDPVARARAYPHQLSGGMRQRVGIAAAIACGPQLLLADEPTTALDVTIQAQILDLLRELSAERRMAVLLITHDLGVVAELCERVLVMYAGRLVEQGAADAVLRAPEHPYTRGLLRSMPRISGAAVRLEPISGAPPDMARPPSGCAFHPRCPLADERCRSERPALRAVGPGRAAACHYAEAVPA